MDANLEEDGGGGGGATAPDPGGTFSRTDGCLWACVGSIWVIFVILFALLLCYLHDDDAAAGGGFQFHVALPAAIAGGVLVAVGCAFWACLGLRFCWCWWSSGCLDRRHDGALDVDC